MSEKPEVTGELVSVKSFAEEHQPNPQATAYAIAQTGIDLFVDPALLNSHLAEINKVASSMYKSIEAKRKYNRDRYQEQRKQDPEGTRKTERERKRKERQNKQHNQTESEGLDNS